MVAVYTIPLYLQWRYYNEIFRSSNCMVTAKLNSNGSITSL